MKALMPNRNFEREFRKLKFENEVDDNDTDGRQV